MNEKFSLTNAAFRLASAITLAGGLRVAIYVDRPRPEPLQPIKSHLREDEKPITFDVFYNELSEAEIQAMRVDLLKAHRFFCFGHCSKCTSFDCNPCFCCRLDLIASCVT